MSFAKSKIDTDYLLSPAGVFKILAVVMSGLATLVVTDPVFRSGFSFNNSRNNSGRGSMTQYMRIACIFTLVVGLVLFLLMLFAAALKLKTKILLIIDTIFCFLNAVLLFVAAILVAHFLLHTGGSIFCFLGTVAWVFSGIMGILELLGGGKVGQG